MDWQIALLIIVGTLIVLMATGMPVAFCFLVVNIIGLFLFWGGEPGLRQFALSIRQSISTFALLPLPLFILMGEVTFYSGIAPNMINALDKWLGRVPGRLSLLAVGVGTLLATLTGVSFTSVAILGSSLVPEMEERGYKKSMSLGPILGSGGLAILIPPSGLAVLLGALGEISIGKILMGIIVPGLLVALLFVVYVITRCSLQPSIAPNYQVTSAPILEKLSSFAKYVLPIAFIVFLVIGVIFLGIATPTEAAATGALGTFILAAAYKKLNWKVLKQSIGGAVSISVMMLMIIVGAKAFGQTLGFSGAARGLIQTVMGLPVDPVVVLIIMQFIVLIMGMFMDPASILMLSVPLFMPIVNGLSIDPVWFAVILLINIELGVISPPFGTSLFVMKAVAPPDTTIGDVYKASLPFVGLDLIAMALTIAFPMIALWLPSVMSR